MQEKKSPRRFLRTAIAKDSEALCALCNPEIFSRFLGYCQPYNWRLQIAVKVNHFNNWSPARVARLLVPRKLEEVKSR